MTTADTTHSSDAEHSGDSHEDAHHHEKPRWDDINTTALVVAGFVSAVLTYATIVACQAFYFYCQNLELHAKEFRRTPQSDQIARQKDSLSEYAKADDGKILIPIDRAMQLTVTEYEK